jgi:hypothetical protein
VIFGAVSGRDAKPWLAWASIMVVAGVGSVFVAANVQDRAALALPIESITIRGKIWDSACAALASHEKMIAKANAKDAKECTLQCVKAGSKFVLYNPDDKTTYQLDDQDKAAEYGGQTVTVTGSYDRDTNTIHVDSITETGTN